MINIMVKNPDTQFLRALAILLILNLHLKGYYPISCIATGGAIGNSIFFFLSAYGLYLSQQKQSRHFSDWYSHRIGRIYPSLWIVLISIKMPIMIADGELSINTITTFMGYFFSPPYTFLQFLLVCYLLAFSLLRNAKKTYILVIFAALTLLYAGFYITIGDLSKWFVETPPFDYISYFMIFIFGIYIAKISNDIAYAGLKDIIYFFVVFGLFYAHKFLMSKGLYFEYQFLQQVALYPMVYYLLKISRSPFVVSKLMCLPVMSSILDFLASKSLEIYIIHETIIYPILRIGLPFPINVILLLISTFILSAIVSILANKLRECII